MARPPRFHRGGLRPVRLLHRVAAVVRAQLQRDHAVAGHVRLCRHGAAHLGAQPARPARRDAPADPHEAAAEALPRALLRPGAAGDQGEPPAQQEAAHEAVGPGPRGVGRAGVLPLVPHHVPRLPQRALVLHDPWGGRARLPHGKVGVLLGLARARLPQLQRQRRQQRQDDGDDPEADHDLGLGDAALGLGVVQRRAQHDAAPEAHADLLLDQRGDDVGHEDAAGDREEHLLAGQQGERRRAPAPIASDPVSPMNTSAG